MNEMKNFIFQYPFMIIVVIIIICIGLYFLFRQSYKKFRSFKLYGVIWEWRWKDAMPIGIEAFCKECGKRIVYDDEYAKQSQNLQDKITFLTCKNCDKEEKGFVKGGDRDYVINLVKRQIMIMKNELK